MNYSPARVIFCAYPSVYSNIVLSKLLSNENIEIVGIVYSKRVYKKKGSYLFNVFQLLKHCGIRYVLYQFCITSLFRLFEYLPFFKVKSRVLLKSSVPILKTKNINDPEGVEFVRYLRPDFLLTVYFNQIVHHEVVMLAKRGGLNLHPSFLPDYKGVDPVFYAMLYNEKELGVSIHKISEEIDCGDIIKQDRAKRDMAHSLFYNNQRLFSRGAELLISTFDALAEGQKTSRSFQAKSGRYDSWPSRSMVKLYYKKNTLLKDYLSWLLGRG